MSILTTSVCVTVPPIIRMDLFSSWLSGITNKQAPAAENPDSFKEFPIEPSVVKSQYHLFESLESGLRRPEYFMSQQVYFPLSLTLKKALIKRYFSLDEPVARELIGRKLVGKTRRDLDDISQRTAIPLVSCRRQFDNLCCVMRQIEEAPALLYNLVQRKLLLPSRLARYYVAILFLNHHHIDVTGQVTVQRLSLDVILKCAHVFIECWSLEQSSLAFDPTIAHDIRDLKGILSQSQDEWVNQIVSSFHGDASVTVHLSSMKSIVGNFVKNVLQIGSGLVNSREICDLLADIVDLVVEPILHTFQLGLNDIDRFFKALGTLVLLVPSLSHGTLRIKASFDSLLLGLAQCANLIAREMRVK